MQSQYRGDIVTDDGLPAPLCFNQTKHSSRNLAQFEPWRCPPCASFPNFSKINRRFWQAASVMELLANKFVPRVHYCAKVRVFIR